jgi:hypothetical protein
MNYRVKLISRASQDNEDSRYRKQLPSKNPKLGACTFTFNALEREYDWLVAMYNKIKVKFTHRGSDAGKNSPYKKQSISNSGLLVLVILKET